MVRFKFRSVKQHDTETINTFYHHILHLARQCQFDNTDKHLIDAIVFGCKSKKAQDKLLQMPIRMMLEECLLICRHESFQWHINTGRPTGEIKAMDGLARQCPRPRPRSNTRRPPSTVCPDKSKNDCTACGTLHQAGECPALSSVCFKCNKQGHCAKLCHSKVQSTTSAPNSNRNSRGSWQGRGRDGRGHESKHAVHEAETTDTSKLIVYATNSNVDVIRLLQAYGMVPTEGPELKHKRKLLLMRLALSRLLVMTLHLNPNDWYYMEVWLNVTSMYSGSCPVKILLCQLIHTSPTILSEWK